MGFFSAVKNVFTGGSGTADKVVDGIINGADALILTEEERIQYDQKRAELWLKLQETLANESTPRSVNRRVVAWTIIMLWAFFAVAALVFLVLSPFADPENNWAFNGYSAVLKVSEVFHLGYCTLAVVGFYFGNHMVSSLTSFKGDKR